MTIRDTSIQSYKDMRPFLAESQALVIDAMLDRPDVDDWTMREIRQEIIERELLPKDGCLSSSVSGRLNELTKMGVLEECEKRICDISGRLCITRRVRLTNYRDWQNEQIEKEQEEERRKQIIGELFTVG